MLEINTIAEFFALPTNVREEIQKAIRTKDRLEDFLRSQNKRIGSEVDDAPHWEQCPRCKDNPGWILKGRARNDSDIHPSQINKCIKFLYYSCAGYEDRLEEFIEPRLQMIFDLGHAWHNTVQKYGKRGAWSKPEDYHPEMSIDPNAVTHDGKPVLPIATQYWIRGHVDALIDKYIIDNVPGVGPVSIRLIHEYKTINSGQYSKLTRPKPEHKFQATIYAAVFDVPIVVYLYTSKDDCKTIDYPVPFDHTIWNDVVSKIQNVQHFINNDQEPPWELTSATKDPAECEKCGFRSTCSPPLKQIRKSG
jgi:CRISPR/Cas system-associated exonuclease Cas4 (RecB family)